MVDDDPRVITLRRGTVVRVGIVVSVLAALGIGLAIGLSVRSPTSPPGKSAAATTIPSHVASTSTTTSPRTTTTTAAPTTTLAPATTTTANTALEILSPQTTPPVSAECSIPLTYSADGNATPLLCHSGGVNVLAWNDYASNHLLVMGLGPGATASEVYSAMCSDTAAGHTTNPIESNAEELVADYNGWSFGNDSEFTEFLGENCPAGGT
jgi:hypothetical protein